jgi:hypothetical protein
MTGIDDGGQLGEGPVDPVIGLLRVVADDPQLLSLLVGRALMTRATSIRWALWWRGSAFNCIATNRPLRLMVGCRPVSAVQ